MSFIKKYWVVIVVIVGVFAFIKPALSVLIFGIIISYMGFEAVIFLNHISKKGINSTGNIIEYQSDSDGNKTPLIEFTTMTDDTIREKPYVYASTDLSKIRTYRNLINQPVPILYDPNNPKKFVLRNEKGFSYIVFIILILGGLLFITLSISWLLGYIKMG